MSKLGKFAKDAQDTKRYIVDYRDWLDIDEQITTVTVVAEVNLDGFIVESSSVEATEARTIIYYVSGGIESRSYNVTVTVATNLSQIKEDQVIHQIT